MLQGDGGTRTASVTGGFVALSLALYKLVTDGVLPEMPLTLSLIHISKANAIGYGLLATAQLRRMTPQTYGGESIAEG